MNRSTCKIYRIKDNQILFGKKNQDTSSIAAIKAKEGCDSYVLYQMQSLKSVFDNYNGEGTVFGSINRKTLEGIKVIVPPLEKKIAL